MEFIENNEAKERILHAAVELFSKKGFDGARVNEIAEAAKVNKALIYYYFKNKEDILDYLVNMLLENVTSIALDFIHGNIVDMIKSGLLDILPDRLHFADENSLKDFLQNASLCYEKVLDFVLENRAILRILMLESLKNSKHHNALFEFMSLNDTKTNLILKTISEADSDFCFSEDMTIFNFFFSIIPLVSFAAYYDDFRNINGLSEDKMKKSFLDSFEVVFSSLVSGNDILLKNEK
ncbi:MAG TPA: TetR family transcriptional regulator [Oscillospiraceae bacterium]|nr:TetR family transcriptional regulator [Oscillospiraceae bacterium]